MKQSYKEEFFEIFARKNSDDTLQHIGSVKAPGQEVAIAHAWNIYDEHAWSEMCIVPLSAVIAVTEQGKQVKIKPI